jgi:hypothetical protein
MQVCMGSDGTRSIGPRIAQTRLSLEGMSAAQSDAWSDAISLMVGFGPGEVSNLGNTPHLIPPGAELEARKWLESLGIDAANAGACALTCTGSVFHHDADSYPREVFCIVWLSDDTHWDLFFPHTGERVELHYGTAVVFDSAQPHGVVPHGAKTFEELTFEYQTGVFLSLDIPVVGTGVASLLGIELDRDADAPGHTTLNWHRFGEELEPDTGRWAIRRLS